MFDQSKADEAVQFIELLKHTKSPFDGQPFVLLPWQRTIIEQVYGTLNERRVRKYKYIYLEVPKKNGKSELVAATALLHMFFDGEVNGEVYGCAGDKEQATLVFDVAVDMIEQVPALKKRAKMNYSTKQITDRETGTFYKVVSAEAYTKHGLNVSAVIFDELHVQPNRDLFDVMTKGAGATRRQPIWWMITTAGNDPDRLSIGWEVHEKAVEIVKARETGNPEKDVATWYPVIYHYNGEDVWNESNWAKANPSLGYTFTLDELRESANEARLSKADEKLFRWLRLNQWNTTKLSGWLPLDLFDSTVGSWSRNDLLGKECYIGGDFSTTTDLSAVALIFPPQEGLPDWRVIWDCWIPEDNMQERIRTDHVPYDQWVSDGWVISTPGDAIGYRRIRQRFLEYKNLYNVIELGADRTFASALLQWLEEDGITCVEVPQRYTELTDPMNTIETLLRSKIQIPDPENEGQFVEAPALTHEAHPVARWCFGNTSIAMNGNAQIKYVKERKGKRSVQTKRIDLIAAWVCGMARAKFYGSHKSIYAERGPIIF